MAKVSATVTINGAFDGWSQGDIEQVDMLATLANVQQLLTDRIREAVGDGVQVEVEVSAEPTTGDRIYISGTEGDPDDLRQVVQNELVDFPWWDGNYWAVLK